MNYRTDLALEAAENLSALSEEDCRRTEQTRRGVKITRLDIISPRAAEMCGKPVGVYVTLEVPPLTDDEKQLTEAAAVLSKQLKTMLPPKGTALTVGLGNRAITPDALGPRAADMVLATRHIRGEFAKSIGLDDLRPNAVLVPGVLGQTGTESSEIVRGVCEVVHPAVILVVDALAARSVHRLGCTVQLCDAGIAPGAGVGNHRQPLDRATLGVPVIGVGVPTVVDAATIAGECGASPEDTQRIAPAAQNLIVTPREVDLMIARAARLVAAGINGALQPAYEPFELISLALS